MDNKSSNSIQIKVENEANIDYGNVPQYEEFKVMPYAACKQEEEKHISNNEEEEFEFILENDETQLSNDSLNNSREFQAAKNVNCHTRRTMVSHFLKHGWSGKSYRDICKRVTEEKVDDYGSKCYSF